MRLIVVLFLGLFFIPSLTKAQDKEFEPESFQEVYAEYQKYVIPQSYHERHLKNHFAEKAYFLGLERFGKDNINTANLAINWVTSFAEETHDHQSPETAFEDAIEIYEKANEDIPLNIIDAYRLIGKALLRITAYKNPKKALNYYQKAINLMEENYGENSLEMAYLNLNIGQDHYSHYNIPKTYAYLKKAHDVYTTTPNADEVGIALSKFWLAKSLLSRKKRERATETMSSALEVFEEKIPNHHYVSIAHAFMVNVLEERGMSDEATKHCQAIGKITPHDPDREYLPVYKKPPKYPTSMQRQGKDGEVLVEFTVDKQGFVQNPVVIESVGGKSFEVESLKTVKKFRYAPRFKDGQPVDTKGVRNIIRFEIQR